MNQVRNQLDSLSSSDEMTMQELWGKDRKRIVLKKKNEGGKMKMQVSGEESHECEGRIVQKVHVLKAGEGLLGIKRGHMLEEEFLATSYLGLLSCARGSV